MLAKIRAMPLSSYWRDIAWQASGNSLAQLVGVLGIPILSRLYSPSDFGTQSLFIQVSVFAAGLMTLRFEYFVQLPETEHDAGALSRLMIALGLMATLVLTPLAWIWRNELADLLGDAKLVPWLVGVPATSFLVSCALLTQHWAQRRRNYRASGVSELVGKASYIGAGLAGALFSFQPGGLIAATAFSALGKIAWLTTRSGLRPAQEQCINSLTVDWRRDATLMVRVARLYQRQSASMVLSHILSTLTGMVPVIVIAHLYGSSVLGQYALVMATVFLPSGLVGTAIGQVYYQRAAADYARHVSIFPLWRSIAAKLAIIGAPLYALIALLSPFAYPFLFGDAWGIAGNIAPMIAITAFFSFASAPMDRTSLIVAAWWYLPIWHTARVITVVFTTALAWLNGWYFEVYIWALVAQHCLAYSIDFLANLHFSKCDQAGSE